MKKILFFFLIPIVFSLASCGDIASFIDIAGEDTADEEAATDASESGVEREISGKLALALGGTAPGTDTVKTSEDLAGKTLDFRTEDDDLIELTFIEGFSNYRDGKGARIIPITTGIGYVLPVVDSKFREAVETITPPQKLIQILIGEGRGQLAREAVLNGAGNVKLTSVSPTGDALGAVIRNRIDIINKKNAPHLFVANSDVFFSNPPSSSYDAIVEAGSKGNFQFSPLYPDDAAHDTYLATARRNNINEDDVSRAYDQAVLTAAYIFSSDTKDPTKGAYAFYSPTAGQYDTLKEALSSKTTTFPSGAGTSNAQYPALSPIQVLILPGIATRSSTSDVPSFVFVRQRNDNDPAVTNKP